MEYASLLSLVQQRRSIHRFKPDPIPDEYIEKILEVARWAPSGLNMQPWEFIVVKSRSSKVKNRSSSSMSITPSPAKWKKPVTRPTPPCCKNPYPASRKYEYHAGSGFYPGLRGHPYPSRITSHRPGIPSKECATPFRPDWPIP